MKESKSEPFNLERLLSDYQSGKIKSFNAFNDINSKFGENPHIDLKTNIGPAYKLYGTNWNNPDPDDVLKFKKKLSHNDIGGGFGSGGVGGSGSSGGY